MVVFNCSGGSWQREDECSAAVRIGEGLAASGRLSEAAMERALGTLDTFAAKCQRHRLDQYAVDAGATSAIREASNGGAFLDRVRLRTGIDVRVLSREQEARYGYLAAVNSTTLADGCVLDLGGGSMQLVRVEDRLIGDSRSWQRGTVRMSERFLPPNGPAKRRQLEELRDHVAAELAQAPWLAEAERAGGRRLGGIGGAGRHPAAAAASA